MLFLTSLCDTTNNEFPMEDKYTGLICRHTLEYSKCISKVHQVAISTRIYSFQNSTMIIILLINNNYI